MVTLELLNSKNNTLAFVSKPAHLIYKSPLLRSITTLVYSPALLFGSLQESSRLSLNLLSNYIEKSSESIQYAKVTLGNPLIQTYSSFILIETHFQGLAYFMHHWWLSTAFFFISNIMLVEILLVSLFWTVATAKEEDHENQEKKRDDSNQEKVSEMVPESRVGVQGSSNEMEEMIEKSSVTSADQDNETLDGESGTEKSSFYHPAEQEHTHIEPQVLSGMLRGSGTTVTYPISRIHSTNRQNISQSGNFSYPYSRTSFVAADLPPAVVQLSRTLSPNHSSTLSSPSILTSDSPRNEERFQINSEALVPDTTMEATITAPEAEEFNLTASTIPNSLEEDSTIHNMVDEFDMRGLLEKDDDLVL